MSLTSILAPLSTRIWQTWSDPTHAAMWSGVSSERLPSSLSAPRSNNSWQTLARFCQAEWYSGVWPPESLASILCPASSNSYGWAKGYAWLLLTIFPFLRKLSLSQKLLVCLKIRAWGTVKTTTMESTQVCWYASVFQPWMKVSFVQTFALVSIFLMHFTMTLSTIDKNTSDLT